MSGLALVVNIVGDARKLQGALGDADRSVGAFGKSIDLGMVTKLAGAATVAVAVGAALTDMTMAAAADRDETNKLAAAIAAATGSTADYTAEVEAAITAGQDRAFTDTQTREALTSLVTATGDVTAATGLLATAQDVARFAGVDLATAADAVAKAQAGSDGALRKLLPGLAKGTTATETLANAQAAAAGQADLFANSTEGQLARSQDAFGELGEEIGSAFLPILDALLPVITEIVRALGSVVKAIMPVLIPAVKALVAAFRFLVDILKTVLGFLGDVIAKVRDAAAAVGRFLEDLPDLPSITLPFTSAAGAASGPTPRGLGAAPRTTAAGGGGVVVNIYGGDPTRVEAAVARALRGYTRRNGVLGLAGMTGRGIVG